MGTLEKGWTGSLAFPQALSSYQNSRGAGCLILPGLQEKNQLGALRSALVQVFWVKNARQEERPFPGLPRAEGENGWDKAWRGGNPFKSVRNSARKQQKEQFSRHYREEKKNLARDTA